MDEPTQNKFIGKIRKAISEIKTYLKNISASEKNLVKDISAVTMQLDCLQNIADLWAKGVANSMNEFEKTVKTENEENKLKSDSIDNVKYSIKESAKYEIKKVLSDKYYNNEVVLTDNTPNILLNQKGVKNLPLAMRGSHIRENVLTAEEAKQKGLRVNKSIHYHGLGENLFVDVIDTLDEVTEAFRGTKNAENSSRRENYFLLISTKTDKDGNIINIPVHINETSLYNNVFIPTNKVATVFGRTELRKYINEQVERGNLVKIKKGGNNPSESTSLIKAHYVSDTSTDIIRTNSEKSQEKFSIKTSNIDSEGNKLTEAQQEFYKNSVTRDAEGRIKPFYHGTARADRVGNYFNPERATSGPMAYFTDNQKIAENYSRDKTDTSLAYDSEYDSYETQFRVNVGGKSVSIVDYWKTLPIAEKNKITQKAEQLTIDDDYENLILKPGNKYGNGGFDLRYARGNALQALVDSWLASGYFMDEEERFLEVLQKVGIENAEYKNPDYREEKVYKVYLNIANPLYTKDIDNDFIADLEDYVENADMSIYESESSSADMWDKNDIDIYDWIERLRADVENGTTHAWTSIPDIVTDFLKDYGNYDGIVDQGGKNGGEIHTVAIPFYSNQIKNVDNLNPTDSNDDIRYSVKSIPNNRVLLSNALETVTQNDIERKYIRDYKAHINLLNEQEAKLKKINEEIGLLSFAPGKRDTARLKELFDRT